MITLLVARHGNTFDPGDTILRVGKRTDLPLSHSGREQAKKLGIFLNEKYQNIDHIFVSELQRTQQTASIAVPDVRFEINAIFDEIDYGMDDGKPESQVVARIGEQALKQWEDHAVPPSGWHVNPQKIIEDWQAFAEKCLAQYPLGATLLVVTSNGIARFAPSIMASFESNPALKMKTGAVSSFQWTQDRGWQLDYWNFSPA